MKNKPVSSLLKHLDFIILDIICLQISFFIAHFARFGVQNPFSASVYVIEDAFFVISQLLFILFSNNYKNILKRKTSKELVSVLIHAAFILFISVVMLYFGHIGNDISRLQVVYTLLIYVPLSFIARTVNKHRMFKKDRANPLQGKRSIALVTSSSILDGAMANFTNPNRYHDYFISQIFLLDDKADQFKDKYENVHNFSDDALNEISHSWVDEVLIIQPDDIPSPIEFMQAIYDMGITLNYTMDLLTEEFLAGADIQKIGKYSVYTNNLKMITVGEQILKRTMDILGGIVGCIITAILFVFIAPLIYSKSPGPIFFAHNRVGKNGKVFKMYKFRSMYMDAEERKAALMEQNKHKDGLMFKMDDDPRIIGSEKKDKNGKPKGIGNFIRNTSLDEFPQFWNVLKGDMSMVGTRPPTLDEWNKYNLSHRIRMSTKPGITGLWQISGRSDIIDFDEVVRLDRQYIEDWSIMLDISIIIKTVLVVLKREGAE